jgi:hypothetical protein
MIFSAIYDQHETYPHSTYNVSYKLILSQILHSKISQISLHSVIFVVVTIKAIDRKGVELSSPIGIPINPSSQEISREE